MAVKTRKQRYADYLKLTNKNKPVDLAKQISNAKTRLDDSGNPIDTRNIIEKIFNVKKDQNALFDIAEVLGRPQQALFGAVKAGQEGKSVAKGALKGLTGEEITYGGQILRNAGMSKSKGVGADDVLGFAADILLDPTNLAFGLGSASKVAGAAKLVKGADVVSDAGKVIGKLGNAGKVLNKAGKATHYLDTAKDIVRPIKKDLTQRAFEAVGKYGVKPAAKLVDTTISKGLQGIDALGGIKYKNAGAKLAQDLGKVLPDGIKQGTNITGNLELYKGLKEGVKNTFNYAKSIPEELWTKLKKSEGGVNVAHEEAKSIARTVKSTMEDYAKKTGSDFNKVDRQATLVTENLLNQEFTPVDIIKNFDREFDNNIIKVTPEQQANLINTLDNSNGAIKYKQLDNGNIKITSVDETKIIGDPALAEALTNQNFTRQIDYSQEDTKLLEEANPA
jgi:hypothetical protein